jgi:hypothetical protein
MLHFAALYGYSWCMELPTLSRNFGLSLEARDKQGRIAREAFEDWTFMPDEQLHIAFNALLQTQTQAGQQMLRARVIWCK